MRYLILSIILATAAIAEEPKQPKDKETIQDDKPEKVLVADDNAAFDQFLVIDKKLYTQDKPPRPIVAVGRPRIVTLIVVNPGRVLLFLDGSFGCIGQINGIYFVRVDDQNIELKVLTNPNLWAPKDGDKLIPKPKGNNGIGNGIDPQPPGNPPVNDDGTKHGDTKGNNGIGNGVDPQPPGNPPINDDGTKHDKQIGNEKH